MVDERVEADVKLQGLVSEPLRHQIRHSSKSRQYRDGRCMVDERVEADVKLQGLVTMSP